jgi:hypothetical protein
MPPTHRGSPKIYEETTRKRPPQTTRMSPAPRKLRTTCGKEGRGLATAPYPALLTKSSLARPDPASCRHLQRMSSVKIGGAGRRPPSIGMGPHWPKHRRRKEGARAPPPPSSSTSRVVSEVNSDGGRVKGRGRRVVAARVSVPPSRPTRSDVGVGLRHSVENSVTVYYQKNFFIF